jgi:hypothetical protein
MVLASAVFIRFESGGTPNYILLSQIWGSLNTDPGPRIYIHLATDPEARIRFSVLPEKKIVGLERGPLSLVSTTEELLDRKVAAHV